MSEHSVLCADYLNSGIGSDSCCPEPAERCQLGKAPFGFTVDIKLGADTQPAKMDSPTGGHKRNRQGIG